MVLLSVNCAFNGALLSQNSVDRVDLHCRQLALLQLPGSGVLFNTVETDSQVNMPKKAHRFAGLRVSVAHSNTSSQWT